MPEIIHYWEDISPGLNLSFGAALGAYLGVNIPKELSPLDGVLLFAALIAMAYFVSTLNVAAKRFHQHKLGFSMGYFVQSLVAGGIVVAFVYALGFGAVAAGVILGAWFCHFVLECVVTSPGLRRNPTK